MRVIGIVGGIASGKSAVAQRLAHWGAVVLSADALGHQVLGESDVRQALVRRWGASVLGADGAIDRSAVAKLVFGTSDEQRSNLAFLENLTHPGIRRLAEQAIDDSRQRAVPAVALDAALLFEKNWHELCDVVLFVDAHQEQRLARSVARGWSPEQFAAREAAQAPLAEKRARADWIIDNSRDLEHLHAQVDSWWRENFPPCRTHRLPDSVHP